MKFLFRKIQYILALEKIFILRNCHQLNISKMIHYILKKYNLQEKKYQGVLYKKNLNGG